jgi:RimJ/RimL family protein N-acetyltransferase
MDIKINNSLFLRQFRHECATDFFESIHETVNAKDPYRSRLQLKYKKLEDVQKRLTKAIEQKFLKDQTPDFFIYNENKVVGVFEFAPLEEGKEYTEIGYWLYEEQRNKGIMSLVFPYMIEYAEQKLKRPKLRAITANHNDSSMHLLKKFKFNPVGTLLELDEDTGQKEKFHIFELKLTDKA